MAEEEKPPELRERQKPEAQQASTAEKTEEPTAASTGSQDGESEKKGAEEKKLTNTHQVMITLLPFLAKMSDRWRNWWIRGIFMILMISAFVVIIHMGRIAVSLLVLLIEIKSFDEVITIGHKIYREHNLPWYRLLNWLFYFTANYFFYMENMATYFPDIIGSSRVLLFLHRYHRLISFMMYISVFILFVLTLKKDYYKVQFSLFAWTHITLLIVVSQAYLAVQNVFEGLYWFVLAVSMVICNDIMAYLFGFFFGRTQLIKLSPKKTWEGFIGAFVSTLIIGFVLSWLMAQFDVFICQDGSSGCEVNPMYQYTPYPVPIPMFNKVFHVWLYPAMLHSLVLSTFASLIAPFGGFFASGFKRAFRVKDFDDLIPGHGGIMDRFDCQLLMATFSNVYYHTFCRGPNPNQVWHSILLLTSEEQLELLSRLQESLTLRGLIGGQ